MTTAEVWQTWAPPLNPPEEHGLPSEVAEQIAAGHEGANPHLIAALLWEAYAATLPPGASVRFVSTGMQSVSYAEPSDPFAQAMARADWHREFLGDLHSVPLTVGRGLP